MSSGQKSTQRIRFHAQVTVEPRSNEDWGSSLIKIFDEDIQIGEYKRNYPSFAEATFEPFELNGQWYALYSPNYTATRILSLPDCVDIGGEEPSTGGFCPVEFYVPRYKRVLRKSNKTGKERDDWWFTPQAESHSGKEVADDGDELTFSPWLSLTTGFVAGCIWGDDASWKLQVIDLSRAAEGIITRSPRFGHIELAEGLSLRESIKLDRFMPEWELRATVIRQERRDVATGQLIDPYDE